MAADCGNIVCAFYGTKEMLSKLHDLAVKTYEEGYCEGRNDRDHIWECSCLQKIIDGESSSSLYFPYAEKDNYVTQTENSFLLDTSDGDYITYDSIYQAKEFFDLLLREIPGIHFYGELDHDWLITDSQLSLRRFWDEEGVLVWKEYYQCDRCGDYTLDEELKSVKTGIDYYDEFGGSSFCPRCRELVKNIVLLDARLMDENKHISVPEGTTCIVNPEAAKEEREEDDKMRELLSVALPNTLQVVEDGVFAFCESLKEVRLPDGLVEIGSNDPNTEYGVFTGCVSLEKIYIPASVERISSDAFRECHAVIYGIAGSYAERYTREMRKKFIAITDNKTV